MALNTSYSEQAGGIAGLIADNTDGMVIESAYQAEASDEIAFGRMVQYTTGLVDPAKPPKALNLSGAPTLLGGVVVFGHEYERRTQLGDTGVKPKNLLSIMRRGRIWVPVEEGVDVTDDVYVRHTASGGNTPGSFRNDADTANAVRLYGAHFLKKTTGAGLTILEFDLSAHYAH